MFEYYSKTETLDETNEQFCDVCNTSLTDILNTHVVGCSNCYNAFKEQIKEYLAKSQGACNHIGKLAIRRVSRQKIENDIRELERQKQEAVENENFIVAESIKNQIEKLRGSI